MFEPATLAAIASSSVSFLVPLLQKAIDKGAEEVGATAATGLLAKLKGKLTHEDSKKALSTLEQMPTDPDAQGAFRMGLRKAMAEDNGLAEFMKAWSEECKDAAGSSQVANAHGNSNKIVQIGGGSGNSVSM